MTPIRILIADDHPMFRFGLRTLLAAEADTEVLGEATDGQQAVSLAASLNPDLILMDINLPHLNGIEATRQIARYPQADRPGAKPTPPLPTACRSASKPFATRFPLFLANSRLPTEPRPLFWLAKPAWDTSPTLNNPIARMELDSNRVTE